MLCENRCCPTCGGKLEVHEVLNNVTGQVEARYWAHALPLPLRNCSHCGVEFRPERIQNAHQERCKAHRQIGATRQWEKNHPAEAKALQQRSSQNRQRKVKLAEELVQELAELKTRIQPKKGPGRPKEPEEQKTYFKIGQQVEKEIPKHLKEDRHSIVAARRLVSEKTRLSYDLVGQYHKLFRHVLSESRSSGLNPSSL
jgi:hypothetical protein